MAGAELQLMDADGANRHAIVPGDDLGDPVAWSPDGKRIAFVGYHYPGGREPGLYVVRADGTDLTMLVPDDRGRGSAGSRGRPTVRSSRSPQLMKVGQSTALVGTSTSSTSPHARDAGRAARPSSPGRIAALAWRPGAMELLYAQQSEEASNSATRTSCSRNESATVGGSGRS